MTRPRPRPRLLALLPIAAALLVLGAACTEVSGDGSGDLPRAISVSGTGEVQAEPSIATLRTGVEVRAESVAEARAGAARAANAVIAVLRDAGIDERDIRTVNFSIWPVYDYSGESPRITGFSVSNTLEVIVRDIDGVGELIDAVATAGVAAARFEGISFAHEDPVALAAQARELAIEDARAKAEQIAELTGVTLGKPISISEGSSVASFVGVRAESAMADSAGTSIQPGTAGVSVTIQASWEIEAD